MNQSTTSDLGPVVHTTVAAPLHPAALAAAICTALGGQLTFYADNNEQAGLGASAVCRADAETGEGGPTACRRAATQLHELAQLLIAQPENSSLWRRAIALTPETYWRFLQYLGAADPRLRYDHIWAQYIWPAIVAELNEIVTAHGAAIAARINTGQTS
ncbi:hypothetical protein AB0B10_25285 [Micromonospora arborensis]|uniref:hypothetical protein n=1 Tax=Micromonospora arborensis TaxID=2116518 RepID=UPI0033FB3FE3